MPRAPKISPRAPSRKPGLPTDLATLRARIAAATLPALPAQRTERARRVLSAWLDSAGADGQDVDTVLRALSSGAAACQIGDALRAQTLENPPEVVRNAACASGCAFCCILTGPDGGTITGAEARALHTALAPFAGQPDGRAWHPKACPALDPETRTCRSYAARPTICRSYLSTDAEACRTNSEGGSVQGGGVLGSHLDYLAVHAMVRAALAGAVKVHSYALRDVAVAAVTGQDARTALEQARHPVRTLGDACTALAGAAKLG